jgi:DNA-binding transcriptional ArsR family regulator
MEPWAVKTDTTSNTRSANRPRGPPTLALVGARPNSAPLDSDDRPPILNYMVKYSDEPLDRTFAALADPTRRALLSRLAKQPGLSVSALAEPFAVSLPAIMKHLDVLSDAGLVARTKSGRTVTCRLNAAPMHGAIAWLNRYERFWSEALSRLADFLEEEESCSSSPPLNPTSPSSGGSKRPPPKSLRPGPTQKK